MRALSHETQHVIIMHAATAENKKSDNSLERQRPRQKTKRKKNQRMYIYENCLILFLRYQRFKCSASFDFMPCIVRSIWIFRNFFFSAGSSYSMFVLSGPTDCFFLSAPVRAQLHVSHLLYTNWKCRCRKIHNRNLKILLVVCIVCCHCFVVPLYFAFANDSRKLHKI